MNNCVITIYIFYFLSSFVIVFKHLIECILSAVFLFLPYMHVPFVYNVRYLTS